MSAPVTGGPEQPHHFDKLAVIYPELWHYFFLFLPSGGGTGSPARCAKIEGLGPSIVSTASADDHGGDADAAEDRQL